jgi:dTDP-4-amino-4,6-dideoxygalactose transaminase
VVVDPPIPFNKPFQAGRELRYIARAVRARAVAGDGPFTRRCAALLERRLGVSKVLMTPSCTAALELAACLCDVRPGDEVILPSFTFVSTANAFLRLGARPVFVDIRRDTLNIDHDMVEAAVTPRTRAIVPVHYAGIACAMDRIMATAARHGVSVIEDAAQAVNAFFHGRALGSIGRLGAFSFHSTKNYTCGEGGALCVNDPGLAERAAIMRDKGTNRGQFIRGEVDRYTWVDVGSSYVPSEIASAYLYAQLERLDEVVRRRRELSERYCYYLSPLASAGLIALPQVPNGCESNHHIFYILLPDRGTRDRLMMGLRDRGVEATFHYVPLHTSPMGRRLGYRGGELPLTEELSGRLLRLPMYFDLSGYEQIRIVNQIGALLSGTGLSANPVIQPAA